LIIPTPLQAKGFVKTRSGKNNFLLEERSSNANLRQIILLRREIPPSMHPLFGGP